MNIELAKSIPLCEILSKINYKPTKENNIEAWYFSPFRNEKTPSFHVNRKWNVWYDFGESKGGNSVDFVCNYLKSVNENHTTADALRWIKNMTGYAPIIANVKSVDYSKEDSKLLLKDKKDIEHPALIQYLEKRGIPYEVGCQYLKEIKVGNSETKKTFFSLGIRNEDAGYELRNPFFKGGIGKKSITFIRGTKPKPDGINIFEGFMDCLSVITHQQGKRFEDDTIILNSLSNLKKATPYINNYGYKVAYTWMDNDEAGKKATESLAEFFKTQKLLQHTPMNEFYEPFKDVNAWHMNKLGLSE
ncbi:MAG: toprim domain-containing protein [Chitinophagaceae bacterium]